MRAPSLTPHCDRGQRQQYSKRAAGNGTTTTTAFGLQPISGVSLATQADALLAQGQIDDYLESVNKVAGTIGTVQPLPNHCSDGSIRCRRLAGRRRAHYRRRRRPPILAALVRNQILQQAASAILAQANQQPALALTLLRE